MDPRLHPIQIESNRNMREFLSIVTEISDLLQTGLNQEQISILIELLSNDINADELAKLILNLRNKANQMNKRVNYLFEMI